MTHQQQSVDIVTEHYAEQLERLIDENRYEDADACLLYTSPSPRDVEESRMPSSAWKK